MKVRKRVQTTKRTKRHIAIVAKPAELGISLPQIQQDLASYKGRLLADLREVERAIEALALVQHAWETRPVASVAPA